MKKHTITLTGIILLYVLSACNSSTVPKMPPTKIGKNEYIYHYVDQKSLDTLDHYRFKFYIPDKKDKPLKKWTQEKIKSFEKDYGAISNLSHLSSLEKLTFSSKLLEYSKQGNIHDRLKFITHLTKKKGFENGNFFGILHLDGEIELLGVLDYWFVNGDNETKKRVVQICLDRLKLTLDFGWDFYDYYSILANENSQVYYDILLQIKQKSDAENKSWATEQYFQRILPEFARIGEKKAIPIILQWLKNAIAKYPDNKDFFIKNAANAFRRLLTLNNIDTVTKNQLNKQLLPYGININNLIADKSIIEISELDKIINIAIKEKVVDTFITNEQKHIITRNFCYSHYKLDTTSLLEYLNIMFTYSTNPHLSFGHITTYSKRYASIMDKFMSAAKVDLSDYVVDALLTDYSKHIFYLRNHKNVFIVNVPDKTKWDYHHELIYQMYNEVLAFKKIDKKFYLLPYDEEDRKISVIYQRPNAVNNFLKAIHQSVIVFDK